MKISDAIKIIAVVLGLFVTAWGIDARFNDKATAAEQKAVTTMQEQQKVYVEQQKTIEYKRDRERLEDIKTDKAMLDKLLKDDPDNELLKDKLEKVDKAIDRLESKIYGE